MTKFQTLAGNCWPFLSLTDYPCTITIGYCFINHHKPTTLCCHGNNFGYDVAYSFAYTTVSADFLRNVPIIKYLHLSTTTHTFLVFYSLDWMHCIVYVVTLVVTFKIILPSLAHMHIVVWYRSTSCHGGSGHFGWGVWRGDISRSPSVGATSTPPSWREGSSSSHEVLLCQEGLHTHVSLGLPTAHIKQLVYGMHVYIQCFGFVADLV